MPVQQLLWVELVVLLKMYWKESHISSDELLKYLIRIKYNKITFSVTLATFRVLSSPWWLIGQHRYGIFLSLWKVLCDSIEGTNVRKCEETLAIPHF
jgi:hypothetical protein